MKYAVLDTNFILSCIRKKIDFQEELQTTGLVILIPEQVIEEIEKLSEKGNPKLKGESAVALNFLNEKNFEKIDLGIKNVDTGLIKLGNCAKNYLIGTLDREIKDKIKNSKIVIRGKKLEII